MQAVILAAGKGVRLQPFTATQPKHMIPLAGKPLICWVLDAVQDVGINDVIVVTSYMEERIRSYLKSHPPKGVDLRFITQGKLPGTAKALECASESLASGDFLVLYGDIVTSGKTLSQLCKSHQVSRQPSMLLANADDPSRYGVVELDGETVRRILEKPLPGETSSNLVNAGAYILSPEVFPYLRKTRRSKRGEYELTDTLQSYIDDGHTVQACIDNKNDWLDVGHLWNLLDANSILLSRHEASVMGVVEPGATLLGSIVLESGARVRSGSYIEGPAYIGSESDIGPNCYIRPSTSIGSRVRIGNGCEVKNSIVMDDTHIAHLSYVGDSVIGSRCNLGAGTTIANLRFDRKSIKVGEGEVRLDSRKTKLGVFMGDEVQTGVNVSTMPGVRIGTGSWIGPGLVVQKDVPPKAFLRV